MVKANKDKNIVLIGMCGAGKSTVGVLLAKAMNRYFLDTDVYIQVLEDKGLQRIIDEQGVEEFCQLEESHLVCIDVTHAVIATGGSAVYSDAIMRNLSSRGIVVHLDIDLETVKQRVTNLYTRGVVMEPGETIETLYAKRQPLYEKYAQITIDCDDKTQEQIVDKIIEEVNLL